MRTKQEPEIEVCSFCGLGFDVLKLNNSGYLPRIYGEGKLYSIPICASCREDIGDCLLF